jgi:hypothetical protein
MRGDRRRSLHTLLALPLALVAIVALWQGDAHLVRHDWLVGAVVFGVGLAAAGATVRQLRRAGLVR